MWWQYLAAVILISFAYPLGRRVGSIAPDEVSAGGKYIFLLRDALVLAAVAVATYSQGQIIMQYALPALIIISYYWFWSRYGEIYPYLIPFILVAGLGTREVYLFTGSLLFLAAFTQGITEHKEKISPAFFPKRYWPLPALGLAITITLVLVSVL